MGQWASVCLYILHGDGQGSVLHVLASFALVRCWVLSAISAAACKSSRVALN